MEMQGYDAIIIFIIILGVLIFIGVVVSYILFSIGLANLARREAIKKAHLAFIPIVQLYIVGEILADNKLVKSGKRLVTIVSAVAFAYLGMVVYGISLPQYGMIDSFFSSLMSLASLAVAAYLYIVLFLLLKRYTKHALVITLVSAFIFTPIGLIAVFVVRNNTLTIEEQYTVLEEPKSI
jgi:hypothetical protein